MQPPGHVTYVPQQQYSGQRYAQQARVVSCESHVHIKQQLKVMDDLLILSKVTMRSLSQLIELQRDHGKLPSQPQVNPKEHCKAINTRSGRVIGNDHSEEQEEPRVVLQRASPSIDKSVEKTSTPVSKPGKDRQFYKFVDMLKNLSINLPFIDAITQIPTYGKFMREVMNKKRRLFENEQKPGVVHCLADLGSYSIPCTVGNLDFPKALLENCASVSILPLSICKKLGMRPTTISLQLADRSIKHPVGVLEDVIVKVIAAMHSLAEDFSSAAAA